MHPVLFLDQSHNLHLKYKNCPNYCSSEGVSYIYIYAFSRFLYKATYNSGYTFALSVYVFPKNRTHNLCAANAMLYHWVTGTLNAVLMRIELLFNKTRQNYLLIRNILWTLK